MTTTTKFIFGKSYINERIDVNEMTWQNIKRKVQKLYQKDNTLVLEKKEKKLLDYDALIIEYNDKIQINNNMIREKKEAKQLQVKINKEKNNERAQRRILRILRNQDTINNGPNDFGNVGATLLSTDDTWKTIEQLMVSVPEMLTNKNILGPFEVKLGSSVIDYNHTFKFNHAQHFKHWAFKFLDSGETDSTGRFKRAARNIFPPDAPFDFNGVTAVSGGCNTHVAGPKKMKSSFYNYELYQPFSRHNNCYFAALKYITKTIIDVKKLRKQYNIPTGEKVSITTAYQIIKDLQLNVEIIDYQTNEELDESQPYLVLVADHFYALTSFEMNKRKDHKTKRGQIAFDFETRLNKDKYRTIHSAAKIIDGKLVKTPDTKSYYLKDSLCCVVYNEYKSTDEKTLTLITNKEKTSARQFIDFLNIEAVSNRSYNVIAHNGSKFDFYFIISTMTSAELIECDIQLRGTAIIGINYRGNLFKDSCCFMTDTLSSLSKSFKVDKGKIVEMELHGVKISSSQLCFYKPELSFDEFIDLQYTDKEFWTLYEKYCLYDCYALKEIWDKFSEQITSLISMINPYLLRTCPLMACSTIGSHSKKILDKINTFQGKINSKKERIERFVDTDEKYAFLMNFKRGGISHCHQPGKHLNGIAGVDIASQYPACLIKAHIPCGYSYWVNSYKPLYHGFYHLKDVTFSESRTFRPVAQSILNTSLNWSPESITELYIDSYMLDYLVNNNGMKYTVVSGLVSKGHILGEEVFGSYVNTFYNEKKRQDQLKADKSPEYNEALRTVIKLYLNSLTGKLVEDPSIHFSLKFDADSPLLMNGVGVKKDFDKSKKNTWLTCGIMVYSYSKRLLFEYIDCLPNKSADVIHVETDGIYFSTSHINQFTENLKNYEANDIYPCQFGVDLGNIKIEKVTQPGQVAYFLGKKFYHISTSDKYLHTPRDDDDTNNFYRIKGIPQSTINDDGSKRYIVNSNLYEQVFQGKEVYSTFCTLQKSLFKEETCITSHYMTRVTRPNFPEYKTYNEDNPQGIYIPLL